MFNVNYETGEIVMNVGDTGSFQVEAHRDDDEPWTEDDRATFTVKNSQGEIVIQRDYALDDETLGNGVVGIELRNADTDDLDPGTYTWEMRYVVNPYYSGSTIVDGDIVRTPGVNGDGEPMQMVLKPVHRDI